VSTTFLDNSLRAWSTAGVIFAVVVAILVLARTALVKRLEVIARRTTTDVDDLAVELLRRFRFYFIVALALAAAARALALPDAARSAIRVAAHLAAFFQTGAWGNSLIAYWMRRWGRRGDHTVSPTTLAALGTLTRFVMWTVLVLFALRNAFQFDITPLITGLGIGGVAIALAVQNILGDLFAAFSIVVDKPFEVGDPISVDTLSGTVEHIGLKTTRVRSVDGEQLVFSNADLLKSRLRNFNRMRERRVVFTMGLTYDTPPAVAARVPEIVRDIVTGTPKARFERCHFVRFDASSLVFEIVYWVTTPDYLDYRDTLHAVNLAILSRFPAEEIEWAYPTRTIRLQQVGAAPAGGDSPTPPSNIA
jgi:small-conductance mechanosensitive channel